MSASAASASEFSAGRVETRPDLIRRVRRQGRPWLTAKSSARPGRHAGPPLRDLRRRADRARHELGRGHPGSAARRPRCAAGAGLRPVRRLSGAFALFRRDRRPLRQPHRATAASRSTASATRPTRISSASTRCTAASNGYWQAGLGRSLLHGADFVTLTLHDPDGAMGFPGRARRHLHLPA